MGQRQLNEDAGGSAAPSTAHSPGVAPAGRLVITTDHLPAHERFDFMREEVCAHHLNFDLARHEPGPYEAKIDVSLAGSVVVSTLFGTPAVWGRSRKALCDNDDGAVLYVLKSGSTRIQQGNLDAVVETGSACLFHAGMPGSLEVPANVTALSIKFPGSALQSALRSGQTIAPFAFDTNNPAIALLSGYAETFLRLPADTDPSHRHAVGNHLADLAALALGPNRDAAQQITGRGLKAARTEAVLKAIREHFARADISAAIVGRTLGITDRQVHRLLEETPKSFYEHVLECRLQEAHRLLCHPSTFALKVADIAFRAGFTDVTYFNRAFKTRFGETPTSVRVGSTSNNSAHLACAAALPAATRLA